MSRITGAALVLLLAACTTGSPNTLVGAATMSSLAIGAAAASRAAGGCIAICTGETVCNPRTGLCEPLPCQGKCGSGEHCAQTLTEIKCVPDSATGVESAAQGTGTKVPAIVPVTPPNPSTGSPTIVPAAEQQPPK